MKSSLDLYNTCVVCGKEAIGETFLRSNSTSYELHVRVVKENRQVAVYREPLGHRIHSACINQLQDYFNIMDKNYAPRKILKLPAKKV